MPGPTRVADWLADQRRPAHRRRPDMIDWIELIPFGETRNYVQRVIENTVIYRAKLGEKPDTPARHNGRTRPRDGRPAG